MAALKENSYVVSPERAPKSTTAGSVMGPVESPTAPRVMRETAAVPEAVRAMVAKSEIESERALIIFMVVTISTFDTEQVCCQAGLLNDRSRVSVRTCPCVGV